MICPNCNEFVPDANYRCPNCRKVVKKDFDMVDRPRGPVKRGGLNFTHFLLIIVVVGLGAMAYFLYQKSVDKGPSETDTVQTSRPASRPVAPVTSGSETTSAEGETDAVPGDTEDTAETSGGESQQQQAGEPGTAAETQSDGGGGNTVEGEAGEKKSDDPYAWVEDEEDGRQAVITHVPGTEVDIEQMVHRGKTTIFDFYSAYCGPCVKISPRLAELERKRTDIAVVKIDINREGVRGIDWGSPVIKQYQIPSIPYFIVYDEGGTRIHAGDTASQFVYRLLSEEQIQ